MRLEILSALIGVTFMHIWLGDWFVTAFSFVLTLIILIAVRLYCGLPLW